MNIPDPPGAHPDLRALQVAFLDALERGEPASSWIAAYPEHAALLAELAEAAAPTDDPPPADQLAATEAIMRQTLQAHLHPPRANPGLAGHLARRGLDFPAVAARLRLPPEILFKIDRRVIPVHTVPAPLLAQLAELLDCTVEVLRAGLAGSRPQTAGAWYHARRPPEVGQQSFADAVQASVAISPADRSYWLALLTGSGPGPADAPPAGAPYASGE